MQNYASKCQVSNHGSEAIKKQTGFSFLYNKDAIKKSRAVTIGVNNMPLDQVLTECPNRQL
jgi:hypothetical protein